MTNKYVFIFFMFFTSVLSFGQKDLLFKNVNHYEFNGDRTIIYMHCTDSKLHTYNTQSGEIKPIANGRKFDGDTYLVHNSKTPLFYSVDGTLYITSIHCVYAIKDEKVLEIPFLYEEYRYGAINSETQRIKEQKMEELRQFISGKEIKSIGLLFSNIYIIEFSDEQKFALYSKTSKNLSKEIEDQINSLLDKELIKSPIDTSYKREDKGKRVCHNYFESQTIRIKEKTFLNKVFGDFMSLLPSKCMYKMAVKMPGRKYVLKDLKRRDHRKLYKSSTGGDLWWNGNLYERLPHSKYISDSKGNVYLLFYSKENMHLYKLSAKK